MHIDYSEKGFEESIEQSLVEQGGYSKASPSNFDRELALDPTVLFDFIKDSQPDEWKRLQAVHGAQVETKFLQRLSKELNNRGMLDVLRHGVRNYGVKVRLAYFAPSSSLNPQAMALYEKNRLTITRQVRYSLSNENSVDLVLSVNGLPVATAELKNPLTGQTVSSAINQYMQDRDSRELLFQFNKRALVHFAVDPDEVYMTTRLADKKTYFLPFNKGRGEGAGNPDNPNGYRTAYLWEEIWQKDSWLDIIARFMHLEVEEKSVGGKTVRSEKLIFPRFHQLDVVRKLEADVLKEGPGKNYLIQHSAGSGKSNSIAWLAHRLASLHNADNEPIFDSVIVITDRRVLDKQLQDTIYQFEHKAGVVERIDKHSGQLVEALEKGKRIIISTLQKFPMIVDQVGKLPGQNYAVIVDEAHSSQTGESAMALRAVLSSDALTLEEAERIDRAEEEAKLDPEDEIIRAMAGQGRKENLSFFGFTATPKEKTLEIFGQPRADGTYGPFHLYSMRQAIEENFILDVLEYYTTYATYYRLSKAIEDDPHIDKKRASRAVARFVSLHPYNLAQKTEVMVEHFRTKTMHKIGGRAKAMVVTSSRLHAVRYKQEFERYIKEKGYKDIGVLVAFSGSVDDGQGNIYTESDMNKFGERELPEKFAGEDFHVLIVADKYQTGYDEPLLHTMFVDKKLGGVKAVQTLSRLNRKYPGKEDTFVLDFVNKAEDIQASFQPFYQRSILSEGTDPNLLYDLHGKLHRFQIYLDSEVEAFCKLFFKSKEKLSRNDHALLNSYLDPGVDRFRVKPPEEQDDFKSTLTTYVRMYSFISQIAPFQDQELFKLHTFGKFLLNKLPRDSSERITIGDEVELEYYRLEKISSGSIMLAKEDGYQEGPKTAGTGARTEEKVPLSEVLDKFNERFGTEFTAVDKVIDQLKEDFSADESLTWQARNNTIDNFELAFGKMFLGTVVNRMGQNQDFFSYLLDNKEAMNWLQAMLLPIVYEELRGDYIGQRRNG